MAFQVPGGGSYNSALLSIAAPFLPPKPEPCRSRLPYDPEKTFGLRLSHGEVVRHVLRKASEWTRYKSRFKMDHVGTRG